MVLTLGLALVLASVEDHSDCLLALLFLRLAGPSQKALEELIVFVEVLNGVGVVGAWTLHELVEVVELVLLARTIGCGDQS